MPELPEVETIARDLRPALSGSLIRDVTVRHAGCLRRIRPSRLAAALRRRRVVGVGRRAKHLVLELDDGMRLVVQLRMTGSFAVAGRTSRDPHAVFELSLERGRRLVYSDVRRLGVVLLLGPDEWEAYTARLGPEPLERGFTATRLRTALSGTRAAVKKALMDQRLLAGVGNIYANEALWLARIDPSRPADDLRPEETAALHRAVRGVLRRAVADRGTTVRDYRTGTGGRGSFQERLAVYGREGEDCLRCGRRLALTHAIDGRATYFCASCQR